MNKAAVQYIQLVYFYRLLLVRYLVLFNLVSLLAENEGQQDPALDKIVPDKTPSKGSGKFSGKSHRCVYYYHGDHLGSSNYITDEKGKVFEHMIYLPYGELWVDEGHDTSLFPYKYTGKIQDEETGLVYFGARYYDPKISSWISTDPADRFSKNSNPISLNLYQYATLNPLRMVDPDGRLEYDSQNDSFKITKGDTLTSISKQTGFSVKELMASNKQIKNADKIQAGDKINIPTKQMKHNSDKKKSDSGANSGVELRNVSHYLGGSGDEMKLNKAEFDRIYKDGKVDGQLKPVMSKDGVFMFQGLIDLYVSDEFNYAYGNATMFFDKDMNPIGFFDRYNMNQSTHRGKLEERDTSRGRSLGSFFESKPFDIIYGKQK